MKPLAHLASRFVNTPLMIHPPKLEVIIRALAPRIGIDGQLMPKSEVSSTLAERYNSAGGDGHDYQLVDGVALIGVQGTLVKRDSWLSALSGCTSYQAIEQQIAAAIADDNVSAILLDIDSPGGETCGCFELSDYIYSARGKKLIYAVANDVALSAAYAIASAADKIYVTRTGAVGSIGVYALHTEQSGFDKTIGVKYTYIHAGARKVDGNPHQPLSEGALADIQAEVDRQGRIFVDTVARNRGASSAKIEATEAGLLWAERAVPLLADEVGTLEDALNQLRAVLSAGEPKLQGKRLPVKTAAVTGVRMSETHVGRTAICNEGKTEMIMNGKKSAAAVIRDMEAQAAVAARQSIGAKVEGQYVAGAHRPLTKEMALARALEANPEAYEAYRAAHNAAPMVAALRAAGVEIRER